MAGYGATEDNSKKEEAPLLSDDNSSGGMRRFIMYGLVAVVVAVFLLFMAMGSDSDTIPELTLPKCPEGDIFANGEGVTMPSYFLGSFTIIDNMLVKSFTFDSSAIATVNYNFPTPNFFSTNFGMNPADIAEWCEAEGEGSFEIQILSLCMAEEDDDYYYLKGVLTNQLNAECTLVNAETGFCRLVKVSKGATKEKPGFWVEYELKNPTPPGFEMDGDEMKLLYSSCPSNTDMKPLLNASFVPP